jgi:hypothetical protein
MFECRFNGRLCVLSRNALDDLQRNGISHLTLREIVERGEDFRDTKMGRGEVGRCLVLKGEVLFAKLVPTYSLILDEEVWLVKHVGKGRMG